MSLRGAIPLPQACTLLLRDRSNIPKDGPSRTSETGRHGKRVAQSHPHPVFPSMMSGPGGKVECH